MLIFFFVIALLQSVIHADITQTLLEQRYTNAKIWQLRSIGGVPAMLAAYGPTVVNFPVIFHSVQGVGNFGPADVALEYDFLVPGLEPILGYAPVRLYPEWDNSTTKFVTTDTLQVDFAITISVGYNPTTSTYAFANQVFRAREYIVFMPNSSLINLGYTINAPGSMVMFDLVASTLPADALCGIILQACGPNPITNTSYLQDTGFTGFADCYAFMSQLSATQPCPYVQRSDTIACRQLHAFSSFFLPSVHCSHVKPNSPVCRAQCLPQCNGCDVNARCVATYPNIPQTPASFAPVYTCQCNNGYIGDGKNCTSILCASGNRCPSAPGTYSCSVPDNRCECAASFTAQPTLLGINNSLCECPSPAKVFRFNGEPVCVKEGRCISDTARHMCHLQNHNEVKCLPQNNQFDTDSLCTCNYGFTGGFEYPCSCAADRRRVWSDIMSGHVCLNTSECTENWHCASQQQQCTGASSTSIGQCIAAAATQKRDLSY
jgi:hypothetical protein